MTRALGHFRDFLANRRLLTASAINLTFVTYGLLSGSLFLTSRAEAEQGRIVSVYADGTKKVITTSSPTVGGAVRQAGFEVAGEDVIEPAPHTKLPAGFFNINVYRAHPVLIVDGPAKHHHRSASSAPRAVVERAKIKLQPEDKVDSQVVTNFVGDQLVGRKITIDRAAPFSIEADGAVKPGHSQATTVGELLRERRLPVGASDLVSPDPKAALLPGTHVVVTRVSEAQATEDRLSPHSTKTVTDAALNRGVTQVKTPGRDGHTLITYKVRYHNGVEIGRDVVKTEKKSDPVTELRVVGTKIPNDVWYRLRLCESGNNYARNSGNGYYGAYQFDIGTWRANGGSGMPDQASPATQDSIAKQVQARRGWSPWPNCSKRLGL